MITLCNYHWLVGLSPFLGLPGVEDDEAIRVADEYTLKEHRSQYSVLVTIWNVLRPVDRGHEGNFPNDVVTKPHVLRWQDSERPAGITYLRSLKLSVLEQRLFQFPIARIQHRAVATGI